MNTRVALRGLINAEPRYRAAVVSVGPSRAPCNDE